MNALRARRGFGAGRTLLFICTYSPLQVLGPGPGRRPDSSALLSVAPASQDLTGKGVESSTVPEDACCLNLSSCCECKCLSPAQ